MTAASYLTPEQVDTLLRGIKPSRVLHLDGMSHLAAYDVRAHLNRVFGFGRWGEKIIDKTLLYTLDTETKNKKPAVKVAYDVTVRLVIKAPDGTVLTEFDGAAVGESIMPTFKQGDAYDMALKTACSQALKRAAIDLGDQFGLSLYRNGSTDPVVTVTLVGKPKADDEATSVEDAVPDVLPEQEPAHDHPPAPPSGETPAPPDGEHNAEAQALADLAARMKTVADLKSGVYDQAKERRLLTALVADPTTGERVQLSLVITAAKANLEKGVAA